MIEVQLQPLIRVVDAQLLKMVLLKRLKAEYVQHRHIRLLPRCAPSLCRVNARLERVVDQPHDPVEHLAVQ